ncbi:ewing's tumor-associated antigen 1 [Anomaloglossus baeobatrachus]|uniref:ewing's tumor-associated antigen 1 n=1 Tax=Anomaloglossus baeobatrachus TaxID=238106 RepID=UPI003F502352
MTSRRRQLRDRAQPVSEEDGDREERKDAKNREGDCDRETPQKPGKKLSRSTRAGAARLCTQLYGATRGEREEELGTNKKTPQRLPGCKQWLSTINSPSNDTDQQQDIFWDPHSPTTFKLENGKRKLAENKCTVDISDIVNRIAPKNEKPSSSESSYLGIWIGEDAIPCTPVVARSRTKMPRSKILQTEEELMKLAKQLDSNLVKQKDQNEERSANSEDEMFSECNAVSEENSFLEDIAGRDDATLGLKSGSQRSAPQSSQKFVDKDVEAALNELFDSSTQKYSGCISQGLSDVSSYSGKDVVINVKSSVHEEIKHSKMEQCSEKPKGSEPSHVASQISTNASQGVRICPELNNGEVKETVESVPRSQDDFEDDWGNDLLEDDSFVMQVTQNPELIATPKNMPPNKLDYTSAHRPGGEIKSTTNPSSSSKTNNFTFVPRKLNCGSEVKPSNLCSTEVIAVNTFQGNAKNTNNAKAFSTTQTRMLSRPQTNPVGQMSKNSVHNVALSTHSTLMKSSQKPCAKAVPQAQTKATNVKDSVPHDEWDDLKFSDEVLDMFCESDSLFEEKEDDDDLLYQVCDDVERLTQAQELNEENHKRVTSPLPNSTCQMLAKKATIPQSKIGSPVIISSPFGSDKSNSRGISPASFSGNCSNAYHNGSLQKVNQTFSRSISVPLGGECKNTILTSTQNPGKSPAVTYSATNPAAPPKYSFTRLKPSQVSSTHIVPSSGSRGTYNDLHLQNYADRLLKSGPSFPIISDNENKPQASSIKRHHSESTIQSSKVFISEDKNKKCSMEEIERKKQEALARRKMKARACSSDMAPT